MPTDSKIETLARKRHRALSSKRRAGSSAGFTLLEAIVALTIVGIALVPVMSFLAEASRQLTMVVDASARAEAQRSVVAYLETLNPNLNPTGEDILSENLTVRWVSTTLVDGNSQTRLGGRLGTYNLGFYIVDVTVVRDDADWFELQARKVGFQPRSLAINPGLGP